MLLSDSHAISDLTVFVQRAARLGSDTVRLQAANGVLTVTVPILVARGILDDGPTVLGLRTMREHGGGTIDRVVALRAITERLARPAQLADDGAVVLRMPDAEQHVAWAGTAVPQHGWQRRAELLAADIAAVAAEGIARVAAALPQNPGEAITERVRSEVWGQPEPALADAPAGAAFAADGLGFLPKPMERVGMWQTEAWSRLSSQSGHVLIRQRRQAGLRG